MQVRFAQPLDNHLVADKFSRRYFVLDYGVSLAERLDFYDGTYGL